MFGTEIGNVLIVRLVGRGSTAKLQDDLLRDCLPQENFPQVFWARHLQYSEFTRRSDAIDAHYLL